LIYLFVLVRLVKLLKGDNQMIRKRNLLFLLLSLVIVLGLGCRVTPEAKTWTQFRKVHGGEKVKIQFDRRTQLPRRIDNMDFMLPDLPRRAPIQKEAMVRSFYGFLEQNRELLKVDTSDLEVTRGEMIGDTWFLTVQQKYQGIPVFHSKIGAVIKDNGRLASYSSDYIPNIRIDVKPKINLAEAAKIAGRTYEAGQGQDLQPKEGTLVIFRKPSGDSRTQQLHLSWKFLMQGEKPNPELDQYFIVDAREGNVLLKWPAFVQQTVSGKIQGQVFPTVPTDPLSTVPMANEDVQIVGQSSDTTDAAGNYSLAVSSSGSHTVNTTLEGPFAKVWDQSGVDFSLAGNCNTSSPCNLTWSEDPGTTVEETDGINVFYHLNLLHDQFYKDILGYYWIHAWSGTSQMRATVNHSFSNAYAGNPIEFGIDAFARSSDVIYHEATHNVMYHLFGNWIGYSYGYGTEGAAMDEGFADYFSCAFTNDSRMGEGYSSSPRDMDNTMQYPYPYSGGAHNNGQIIAGAVWDLRTDFGLVPNDVDKLAFEALNIMSTGSFQYYFSDPGHSNLLSSLLLADDNNYNLLDGTPHDRQIFQAFRNHDLLPCDVYCRDSSADSGDVPNGVPFWTSPDIIVDALPYYSGTGDPAHEDPELGSVNKVHVRIRNLGYLTVSECTVKLYYANPSTGLTWPSHWQYIGEAKINNLQPVDADADGKKVVIDWKPSGTGTGHRCLFVRVECDEDIITEEGNVRQDNNIAQKNIHIVDNVKVSQAQFILYPDLPFRRVPLRPQRSLKFSFPRIDPQVRELKATVVVPDKVKIFVDDSIKPYVKRVRVENGFPLVGRKYVWEITIPTSVFRRDPFKPVREIEIPFSCSSKVRVTMTFESKEMMPEPLRPTVTVLRIAEARGRRIIGGLDYHLKSK
jgi:hypothetical protein